LTSVISVKNLVKEYVMGTVIVRALRGVSVDIYEGEMVAIMGPSGSGKSTLMNILGCLDRPTGGEYWLGGEEVSQMPDSQLAIVRNEKIGFVFQNFNLLPRTSALKNVELPLVYSKRRDREERATAALEKVGLGMRMDHKPNQLSGGQQQRVAIARALINDPPLLLADEPTGNLDPTHSVEIMTLLQELNAKGTTVIVASHDIATVSKMRARVIELDGGRIAADTPAGEEWVPVTRALEGEIEPQHGGMERMSLASLAEESEEAESDEAVLEQFIEEEEAEDDARPH